jgi:hypothetical protein
VQKKVVAIISIYLLCILIGVIWYVSVHPRADEQIITVNPALVDGNQQLLAELRKINSTDEQTGGFSYFYHRYLLQPYHLFLSYFGRNNSAEQLAFTPEKIRDLQETVTAEDKLQILNIIRKRFTPEEIANLLTFSQGGVTEAEKQEIKTLLQSRLTPEEFNLVNKAYLKYTNR